MIVRIYIVVLLTSALLFVSQLPGAAQQLSQLKVVLVGDSTVATQGGWGPGFCSRLNSGVDCIDLAANGRSTKSFIDEGLWAKALDLHGQFYFIQFGHNDQKIQAALHTEPETTFKANLHRYIKDVRNIGGTPILVTSLSRRNYKDGALIVDPLREYAAATREVAAEDVVPVIDLYALSRALLDRMTQEQADRYDATTHPDARIEGATLIRPDRTHLNDLGKQVFGDMVARAALQNVPSLGPYVTVPCSTEK